MMIKSRDTTLMVLTMMMITGLAYANEALSIAAKNKLDNSLIIRQKTSANLYLKRTAAPPITPQKFSLTQSSTKPKLSKKKGIKKLDERFTPTETISEDLSVSFPVDI